MPCKTVYLNTSFFKKKTRFTSSEGISTISFILFWPTSFLLQILDIIRTKTVYHISFYFSSVIYMYKKLGSHCAVWRGHGFWLEATSYAYLDLCVRGFRNVKESEMLQRSHGLNILWSPSPLVQCSLLPYFFSWSLFFFFSWHEHFTCDSHFYFSNFLEKAILNNLKVSFIASKQTYVSYECIIVLTVYL